MSKVVFENEATPFLRIAWPQPALAGLIAYYFEVDARSSTAPVNITGLPAVNTLIEIDLVAESGFRLMGHLTKCVTGLYAPGSKRFYAKLHPGAFTRLFSFSPQHIQDSQVEINSFFHAFSRAQFAALPSFRSRIDHFEDHLIKQYNPFSVGYRQQYVDLFINIFSNAQYCRPECIQALCEKHHITYASLRRYFLEQVGVSPKYCQKVIRFKGALQAYRTFGYGFNYTDLGYADFSHFCKDARGLTGRAPLEL
jgi:methylphosphotriester-DNA--protein-cysteine methyltransferase